MSIPSRSFIDSLSKELAKPPDSACETELDAFLEEQGSCQIPCRSRTWSCELNPGSAADRDDRIPAHGEAAATCFGLGNPNIDFAKLAANMGVGPSGPITDPKELAAAIRRGIDVVKRGERT